MVKAFVIFSFFILGAIGVRGQAPADPELTVVEIVSHTPIKNQANSSTCWSFSVTSLLESEAMRNGTGVIDLSEMFQVRNTYIEKARNYILRQGAAQFGPGGLGHDVINAISKYGAVPEHIYSGLMLGQKFHDHQVLDNKLKSYLDNVLKSRPIPADWMSGYQQILDDHLGTPPESFTYNEHVYTPKTFASEVLKFKREDFVFLTSFSHHPFYFPFILEIPDNYANESYYNIPLNELTGVVIEALEKGYSVMWNTDVSNTNFRHKEGYAMVWKSPVLQGKIDPDSEETLYDQAIRQQLFETLVTQDDHLMHIVGLEKTKNGKTFFLVKNSWGDAGPFEGYVRVSETYFALNTITVIVSRAALPASLKSKLRL